MKVVSGEVVDMDEGSGEQHHIGNMTEVERFTDNELNHLKIIYHGMANKAALNHFRELRTKILSKEKRKNFCCLVSSVSHGGGASFVSANLSAAFALDQTKSSLLIDCNLHDPSAQRLLPGDTELGLTDYLTNPNIRVSDIVHASGVPRLRVIPLCSHLESAAEYFSSERMKAFLREIRLRYHDRFIFIDAPQINTAESRILAELADFSVLVVPYGKVTKQMIHQAADVVGEEKLMGMIFNN